MECVLLVLLNPELLKIQLRIIMEQMGSMPIRDPLELTIFIDGSKVIKMEDTELSFTLQVLIEEIGMFQAVQQ